MLKTYLSVIRNRNFRNLWLGQITSQVALNMLYFILAIKVYLETRSNAAVSYMLLSFGLPAIVFGIIAGSYVDQKDKRKVLLYCNLLRAFMMVLFFIFKDNLYMLYFLSIVISIITQLFIPAEAPAIPFLVKSEELLTANSLFTVSFYLSTLSGFILAGPFLKLFGYNNVFIIMTLVMVLAYYFISKLPALAPTEKSGQKFNPSFIKETLKEGLSFIKDTPRVKQSLILMTFSQALISTLAVLAPGFADKILTIELSDASYLVMGPAAVGLVIGALWVGAYGIKYLKGTIILIGIIATGVTLLLLSLLTKAYHPSLVLLLSHAKISVNNLTVAMVLLLFIGIFNSFMNVPASTILQEDTDTDKRGRVYGVLTSLTGGVSFLPVVFSGVLADLLGVSAALFVLGIFIIIIGIQQYWKRQQI